MPLAGTVTVPLTDGTSEDVALTGFAHVTVQFPPLYPTDPMRIGINLDQVQGTGAVTGISYLATGANRFSEVPEGGSIVVTPGFDLRWSAQPGDPVTPSDPVLPLDIRIRLNFNNPDALGGIVIKEIRVPVD